MVSSGVSFTCRRESACIAAVDRQAVRGGQLGTSLVGSEELGCGVFDVATGFWLSGVPAALNDGSGAQRSCLLIWQTWWGCLQKMCDVE